MYMMSQSPKKHRIIESIDSIPTEFAKQTPLVMPFVGAIPGDCPFVGANPGGCPNDNITEAPEISL